jgi:hypothetical protein
MYKYRCDERLKAKSEGCTYKLSSLPPSNFTTTRAHTRTCPSFCPPGLRCHCAPACSLARVLAHVTPQGIHAALISLVTAHEMLRNHSALMFVLSPNTASTSSFLQHNLTFGLHLRLAISERSALALITGNIAGWRLSIISEEYVDILVSTTS